MLIYSPHSEHTTTTTTTMTTTTTWTKRTNRGDVRYSKRESADWNTQNWWPPETRSLSSTPTRSPFVQRRSSTPTPRFIARSLAGAAEPVARLCPGKTCALPRRTAPCYTHTHTYIYTLPAATLSAAQSRTCGRKGKALFRDPTYHQKWKSTTTTKNTKILELIKLN